jgi:hypothetical protein
VKVAYLLVGGKLRETYQIKQYSKKWNKVTAQVLNLPTKPSEYYIFILAGNAN